MRGGYSISFNAENDFVLNSHILSELWKELKSKMRLKTASASTHKEATYGEIQRHKEQIQSLLKNLKKVCQTLHCSSKKYGNRNGGARKYYQWATVTFLKRKQWRMFKRIHRKTINISRKRVLLTYQKERYSDHHRKGRKTKRCLFWRTTGRL